MVNRCWLHAGTAVDTAVDLLVRTMPRKRDVVRADKEAVTAAALAEVMLRIAECNAACRHGSSRQIALALRTMGREVRRILLPWRYRVGVDAFIDRRGGGVGLYIKS